MKKVKKLLSILLVAVMLVCIAPITDLGIKASAAVTYYWPISTSYDYNHNYTYSNLTSSGRIHGGLDFAAPIGTAVYASADGTVISPTADIGCTGSHNSSGISKGWGCSTPGCSSNSYNNVIYIQHSDGKVTLYAHLKTGSFKVGIGDSVKAGQQIAESGVAGNTTGPHLHFEIRVNNKFGTCDPANVLVKSVPTPEPFDPQASGTHVDLVTDTTFRPCIDMTSMSGVSSIKVAVWATGDQSDIKWYGTVNNGVNVFFNDIPFSNHASGAKIYYCDFYAYGYCGEEKYIGGCTYTPSHNPIGDVNSVIGGVGTVYIYGWAFDEDNYNASLNIHIYIGDEGHNEVFADKQRTDVNDYYGCGNHHGFSDTLTTKKKGDQHIEIFAINVEGGQSIKIWEGTVYISDPDPFGDINVCEGQNGLIHIRGWAYDPNDYAAQLEIHAYIGGVSFTDPNAESHNGIIANKFRDDVGSTYGVGNYHGFDTYIRTNKTGIQNIYIYAINVGNGENKLLATKSVNISAPDPFGKFEACEGLNGQIRIKGWALDSSEYNSQLEIHAYIGGVSFTDPNAESHNGIIANTFRDDVGSIYGSGDYHGFDTYITTSKTGTQDVYVYAINVGSGNTNTLLGVKTVYINPIYKITFNNLGSSCSNEFSYVPYNSPYGELPVPTREGYKFEGWFTEAEGGTLVTSDTIVTATADHTLYAHWSGISAKEGSTAVIDGSYIYGLKTKLTAANIKNIFLDYEGVEVTLTKAIEDARYYGTGSTVTVKYSDGTEEVYTIIIFGDIDGNAIIDSDDAFSVLEASYDNSLFNAAQKKAANVDGVRRISIDDYSIINDAALGISEIDQTAV